MAILDRSLINEEECRAGSTPGFFARAEKRVGDTENLRVCSSKREEIRNGQRKPSFSEEWF